MEDFAETIDFLFGLRNSGSKYGFERMVRFAAAAGNPEKSLPVIHVAGTNGKGSVCAMVESCLRSAGYRTGFYTSPHLVHLGERIQIDRRSMTEAEIVQRAAVLRKIARQLAPEGDPEFPSFFEFMTLMAFQAFAEHGVDCAVVEVGLGGRLDATNIVDPKATAITSIGLDHCEILGDSLAAIAGEKAGILKPGVPVILGHLPEEARGVVRARAGEVGCPVIEVGEQFSERDLPETNLVGRFQRWNAGVAHLLLDSVRMEFPVSAEIRAASFRQVSWPGRWEERLLDGRRLIVDCTHNPEGAIELHHNLRDCVGEPSGNLDVIVGSLGLERAHAVLKGIAPYAARIHLVRPNQPRARSFAEMRAGIPEGYAGEVVESSVAALFPGGDRITVNPGPDPVLLTGSLYLVGEVYARIEEENADATGSLQDRI